MTRAAYGGSCYLNNAGVAAQHLRNEGADRVAIVDVDAHHGNGAQDVFWERADVFTGSVHVDPRTGWFPHFLGTEDERGSGDGAGANLNIPLPPGTGDELWVRSVAEVAQAASNHGVEALVVALGVDAAAGDPESPLQVSERGYRAAGRVLGGYGLPTIVVQEGGYDLATIGGSCSPHWPESRKGCMAESSSSRNLWVGKDEVEGVAAQPRKDIEPPPHWRLEAVAATERPRSLTLGADGRTAVFIQDRDTSDVWLLDLDDGVPRRLTTGRDPAPYWEDTEPRLSPDGTMVAFADGGHVWLVPAAGGPPRKLVQAESPVWLGNDRLVVGVERDRATRLAVVEIADPWPRPLCSQVSADERERGDEGAAAVSPDGAHVAFAFTRHDDLKATEIRVVDAGGGSPRKLSGEPGMADREPAWSPDGSTIAFASERDGWWGLYTVDVAGGGVRRLTEEEGRLLEASWHPDGSSLVAVRGRRNRFDLVVVDAATGDVQALARRGDVVEPSVDGGRRGSRRIRGSRHRAATPAVSPGPAGSCSRCTRRRRWPCAPRRTCARRT